MSASSEVGITASQPNVLPTTAKTRQAAAISPSPTASAPSSATMLTMIPARQQATLPIRFASSSHSGRNSAVATNIRPMNSPTSSGAFTTKVMYSTASPEKNALASWTMKKAPISSA